MQTIEELEAQWILCPIHKGKTRTELDPDTVLIKNYPLLPLKNEFIIGVIQIKTITKNASRTKYA